MKRKIRNDLLLAAVLLTAAAAAFFLIRLFSHSGAWVIVRTDGVETARYPLAQDREIVLYDGEESNTLVISGGMAWIRDASCPDRLCVRHRPISRSGETIVCLPHRLVIEISGGGEPDVDAVA